MKSTCWNDEAGPCCAGEESLVFHTGLGTRTLDLTTYLDMYIC